MVCIAAALIAAVLLGSGKPKKQTAKETRRTAVAGYIIRVGRIQIGMAKQVRAIDASYKKFASSPQSLKARVTTYRKAQQTLSDLRDELKLVVPPPDARKLHRLVVRLADENVVMAGVVTSLAAYLPALSAAEAPLAPSIARLRTGIRSSKTARRQAVAFETYAAETGSVASRIERITPPADFAGARAAELRHLQRLAAVAHQIADALRHKQPAQAQKRVADLSKLEADTSVVRAQRVGALAYNARLGKIAETAKEIEVERRRLEKKVPAS